MCIFLFRYLFFASFHILFGLWINTEHWHSKFRITFVLLLLGMANSNCNEKQHKYFPFFFFFSLSVVLSLESGWWVNMNYKHIFFPFEKSIMKIELMKRNLYSNCDHWSLIVDRFGKGQIIFFACTIQLGQQQCKAYLD